MIETHFHVAHINNINLSINESAAIRCYRLVGRIRYVVRATMLVRHAMKLLVTIIDSRLYWCARARSDLLNYFVTQIPRSVQVTPLVCYAHKRSTAAAPCRLPHNFAAAAIVR